VSCKIDDVDLGVDVMKYLNALLSSEYNKKVNYYKNHYNTQIQSKKFQFVELESELNFTKKSVENMRKRIEILEAQLDSIDRNNNKLIEERNELLKRDPGREDSILNILYSNTLQQNLLMANLYKNEINWYFTTIDEKKFLLKRLQNELDLIVEEMQTLESTKNNLQNLQIIKPPTPSSRPVSPNIKLNVLSAFVISFVFMVFLAFVIEYIVKRKRDLIE
jgi:hypothetical protein